jgi:hypothetical protein
LEDNITQELYDEGKQTASEYSDHTKFETQVLQSVSGIFESRNRNFKQQLESHKETV